MSIDPFAQFYAWTGHQQYRSVLAELHGSVSGLLISTDQAAAGGMISPRRSAYLDNMQVAETDGIHQWCSLVRIIGIDASTSGKKILFVAAENRATSALIKTLRYSDSSQNEVLQQVRARY